MDAIEALDALAAHPDIGARLTRLDVVPARPARFGETDTPLHPEVLERLAARGAERLYVHQAEAVTLLRAGRSVALATGTGSGKSLCYQAPIAESVLSGGKDTALLLFPTKALAHDQLRSLRSWLVPGMRAVAYDGDTPAAERASLRRTANVVLTNPDMLHAGILPYHDRWATFLMRLRYVVVDELHTLRGIFGSHVAHLLRRLRRVCLHYGAEPAFCFASATIGNPAALAGELCGRSVHPVDDDGSPRGPRAVALLDRPMVDEARGRRASATAEVGGLLAHLVAGGLRTIAFSPSRRSAELVARHARRRLEDAGRPAGAVAAYRGGYLPEERRQLERALARGQLLGVAATNALELGIDVAGLDAVVLQGFPGTLASFWQQAGRAGRALQPSAAILVAGDDQLDRWYLDHPGELFSRSLEPAVVNPRNPFVAEPHVGCAAYELPLAPDDPVLGSGAPGGFGDAVDDAVRELVLADALKPRGGKMYWARPEAPAPHVGLRTGSSVEYRLYAVSPQDGSPQDGSPQDGSPQDGSPQDGSPQDGDSARLVGTVDGARAFHVAHPGAIYLHQGRQYRVAHLDLDDAYALLAPLEVDEYTQPRHDIDIAITAEDRSRAVGRSTLHLGGVEVTTTTVAYQRRRIGSGEVLETVDLTLPPRTLATRAGWYTIPAAVVDRAGLDPVSVLSAAHAAEHALIGMLPLFAICDRWDVGGVSMAAHPATGEPTIFVYDGYPGGAGIAELAFDAADRHLAAAHDVVAACPCETGCPSCVQSPKCGNWNEFLAKNDAVTLMGAILGSFTSLPRSTPR